MLNNNRPIDRNFEPTPSDNTSVEYNSNNPYELSEKINKIYHILDDLLMLFTITKLRCNENKVFKANRFYKTHKKVTKISNHEVSKQINIYKNKFDEMLNEIINANEISDIIRSIIKIIKENDNPLSIIYHLQYLSNGSYHAIQNYNKMRNPMSSNKTKMTNMFNLIKIIILYKKGYCSIINLDQSLNEHNSHFKCCSDIAWSILIYFQFKCIQNNILKNLKKNNIFTIINHGNDLLAYKEFIDKNQKIVDQILDNDNEQVINELKKEIKETNFYDIHKNKTIVDYVCKVMQKMFPNYKNIKSNKLNKALKISNIYRLLGLYDKKLQNTVNIEEIKAAYNKYLCEYKNNPIIKKSFYNISEPLKYISYNNNNYKSNVEGFFNDIIFQFMNNHNIDNIQEKCSLFVLQIYDIIKGYKNLLTELKTIKKNTIKGYTSLVIFNYSRIDLYSIKKIKITKNKKFQLHNENICEILKIKYNNPLNLPTRDDFMLYFIIIYEHINKKLFNKKNYYNYLYKKSIKVDKNGKLDNKFNQVYQKISNIADTIRFI